MLSTTGQSKMCESFPLSSFRETASVVLVSNLLLLGNTSVLSLYIVDRRRV